MPYDFKKLEKEVEEHCAKKEIESKQAQELKEIHKQIGDKIREYTDAASITRDKNDYNAIMDLSNLLGFAICHLNKEACQSLLTGFKTMGK